MHSIEPIIDVLRYDLEDALQILIFAAIWMALPACLLALFSAVRLNGVFWVSLFKAMGIAWIIATVVSAVVFILCSGIQFLICSALQIPPHPTDPWGFIACLTISFIVSCWATRRWSYRRLAAGVEFRRQTRDSVEVKAPPTRFTFSLRTLFLGQLLLIVPVGLWIGVRRETIISRYRARAELEQFVAWKSSVEQRFKRYGWLPSCSQRPRQLHLFGTRNLPGFTDAVLATIEPADELILLHLNSNSLTDEGLLTISQIKTISDLNLESNQVTDTGIAHLKALPNLDKLVLDCPSLTEKALKELQQCRRLKRLHLLNPSISAEAEVRFKWDRPDVELIARNPPRRMPKPAP